MKIDAEAPTTIHGIAAIAAAIAAWLCMKMGLDNQTTVLITGVIGGLVSVLAKENSTAIAARSKLLAALLSEGEAPALDHVATQINKEIEAGGKGGGSPNTPV